MEAVHVEIDTRFKENDGKLQEAFQVLEARGFQPWPEPVSLTHTVFVDGLFQTKPLKTVDEAKNEVASKAHDMSKDYWQSEAVIEKFDQNQQRAHIFVRKKFSEKALGQLADIVEKLYVEKVGKRDQKLDGTTHVEYIVDCLKSNRLEEAKNVCFNQSDKFDRFQEIQNLLEDGLFTPEEHTPWSFTGKRSEFRRKQGNKT